MTPPGLPEKRSAETFKPTYNFWVTKMEAENLPWCVLKFGINHKIIPMWVSQFHAFPASANCRSMLSMLSSLSKPNLQPNWVWVYFRSSSSSVPFPCDVRAVRLDAAARVRSVFQCSASKPALDVAHLRGTTTKCDESPSETKNTRWCGYLVPRWYQNTSYTWPFEDFRFRSFTCVHWLNHKKTPMSLGFYKSFS